MVLEGVQLIEQLLVLLPSKTTKLHNPQAHNYSFGMILHKQINAGIMEIMNSVISDMVLMGAAQT